MSIDFSKIPNSINEQAETFDHSIKCLSKIDKPSKLLDDQQSFEALYYLFKIFDDELFVYENSNWGAIGTSGFDKFLVNLLEYICRICNELGLKDVIFNDDSPMREATQNQKKFSLFYYMVTIIPEITSNQFKNEYFIELNKKLLGLGLLPVLISFYSQKKFLYETTDSVDIHDCMVGITAAIMNITENPTYDKKTFRGIDIENKLKGFKCKHDIYYELSENIIFNINSNSFEDILYELKNKKGDQMEIIDDYNTYADLFTLCKSVQICEHYKQELFVELDTEQIFSGLLAKLYEIRKSLNFDSDPIKRSCPNKDASLNERRISIIRYILTIINWVAVRSVRMNMYYRTTRLVRIILGFLSDDGFIEKIFACKEKNNKKVLISFTRALYVLSKFRSEWNGLDLNPTSILLNLINKFETFEDKNFIENFFDCLCYFLPKDDAKLKEIESLKDLTFYINKMLDYTVSIASNLQTGKHIERVKSEFILGDSNKNIIMSESSSIMDNNMLISLVGILDRLKRICFNSEIIKLIFTEKASFKTILFNGNYIEKYYILSLFHRFVSSNQNKEILKDVINDKELVKFINELQETSENGDKSLIKIRDNILEIINR